MIKFFRHIRQQLLNSGQMKKYTLYAIGEIFLVVIGILIALQINNWNVEKNQRQLEQSILSEMKDNLQSDLRDIRGNLKRDSTSKIATLLVLNHLENSLPLHDSLKLAYGTLGQGSLFEENTSAFENLKSLGFNLISNDDLRRKITFLYSARYEYMKQIFGIGNDFYWDKFISELIERTTSETGNYQIRKPNNLNQLASDLKFKELLRQDVFMKRFTTGLSRRVKKDIVELISLIDKELSL